MKACAYQSSIIFLLIPLTGTSQGSTDQVGHLRTGIQFTGKIYEERAITTAQQFAQLWHFQQVLTQRQHFTQDRTALAHTSGDTLQVAQLLQGYREPAAQSRTFIEFFNTLQSSLEL